MCGLVKRFLLCLLLFLFFVSAAAAPQEEEAAPAVYMPVYLISERELLTIETYLTESDRERQTWLSQVQELRTRAGNSETKSENLERDLRDLNLTLSDQRKLNLSLPQSYNKSEAEHLTAISIKNGKIADLEQTMAEQVLKAETYKGTARSRLIIIIGLAGSWIVFIGFKVCRFLRII
jgi:DNA repair exonuclease SbcCD ATPase subunit